MSAMVVVLRTIAIGSVLVGLASPVSLIASDAPQGVGAFRRLAIADGLVDNVVYGVVQDTRGFMWLGTEGGLVRYDGREFRSFDLTDGAGEEPLRKDISTLRRGSNDVLWVGTWGGGLVRFDPVSERVVRYMRNERDPRTLSDDRVQTVYEDRSGRVWVGTFNGLNRLDVRQGSFVRFEHVPGQAGTLSHSRIWSVSQGPDGGSGWGPMPVSMRSTRPDASRRRTSCPCRRGAAGPAGPARVLFHDQSGDLWAGGQRGSIDSIRPARRSMGSSRGRPR